MSNKKRKKQVTINNSAPKKNEKCGKDEITDFTRRRIISSVITVLLLAAIIVGVVFLVKSCNKYTVEISVVDYGKITVELDGSAAPKTVKNFVSLVEDGFYDGLTFHRVMADFMIQGGDPKGNGTGNGPNTVVGEFEENGHYNPISHERGVISMARGTDPDSASCQFFICNADSPHLDGKYAAFGRVISGIEVVDAITEDFAFWDGVIYNKTSQPVIEYIKIVK